MRTALPLALLALACDAAPDAAPEAAPAAAPAVALGAAGVAPAATAPAAAAAATAWTAYGAEMAEDRPVVAAGDLLADPSKYVDQQVRVEGRVADVCQKMGCWMVVAEGDQSIRVTMKDHGFSVDKQGAGSDCQVDGTVIAKKLDPEEVAHFESESKEGVVPEKQVKGDVVYEIVADSVRMKPTG